MAEPYEAVELVGPLVGALGTRALLLLQLDGELVQVAQSVRQGRTRGGRAQQLQAALHLGLGQEGAGAADAVGDPGRPERLLEQQALGVGAGQHGDVAPRRAGRAQGADAVGDAAGLVQIGGVGLDRRERAGRAVRPQPGAAHRRGALTGRPVEAQYRFGDGQDLGRGAVVVDQAHRGRGREAAGRTG